LLLGARDPPPCSLTPLFLARLIRVSLRYAARPTALHPGDVAPEMLQAVGAAEKRGEVCRVHHQDVAGALAVRWQPEQAVELFVAGRGEGMRAVRVNGLTREQLHCFPVLVR